LTSLSAAAPAACPIEDLTSDYQRLVAQLSAEAPERRVAVFRRDFIAPHRALFAKDVLGFTDDTALDRAVPAAIAKSAANEATEVRTAEQLRRMLPEHIEKFARTFPDFRCDFTLYLTGSLGQLDGAGRIVDGRPALVLGVDVIARVETPAELPLFVDHELFHRYHFRAAGFSDDPGEHQAIWRALWAEGMATYISWRLNPRPALADAFLLPRDLAEQANPMLPRLSRDLLAGLDRIDPALYAQYFEYGSEAAKKAGTPFRAGYYVGFRVAEHLAQGRSLVDLAHLQGPSLEAEIRHTLEAFANGA
jgi:hypothetical protein